MKFQVDITGNFNKVVGLVIEQNFHITIRCAACNMVHENVVYITDKMKVRVPVRGNPDKIEVYNLLVECRNKDCLNKMYIKLIEPENKITIKKHSTLEDSEVLALPIENEVCHISTVQSDSAILKDVDGLILDAVDNHGKVYENCEFKDRVLVEVAQDGETVDIQNFRVIVKQL